MTFQSRSHLIKHGTSHTRKTQVISAKINTFLESFSASLENDMLGLEDGFDGGEEKISANSEFDDHSVRLSVDTNPESLEAAAAEAAFAFGHHDLPEDLMVYKTMWWLIKCGGSAEDFMTYYRSCFGSLRDVLAHQEMRWLIKRCVGSSRDV